MLVERVVAGPSTVEIQAALARLEDRPVKELDDFAMWALAMFEATGLFEIFKSENGQSYVADKLNVDRTSQPSI